MMPGKDEYNEYYQVYIDQVPDEDVIEFLRSQQERFNRLIKSIPAEKVDFRYAEGKWTAREVVGHVLDAEWVFSYRALRIARNDKTPLAGMDQDDFILGANFDERTIQSLGQEFDHIRSASILEFSSFDESILARTGTASGFPFTVRALVYVIGGHVEHHIRILEERYL